MTSVTRAIKNFKQPYGGFLKVKEFMKEKYDDEFSLNSEESIPPGTVGLVTEYLTEFMLGIDKVKVFSVSIHSARIVDSSDSFLDSLNNIQGLDDASIINACKLSACYVIYRAGPQHYKPIEDFDVDKNTIENIRAMVKRSLYFFENNGPVIESGFNFKGAYTNKILTGDGDILTEDGLWDMKVSKNNFTSKQTLQLLVYYLMGLKSENRDKFIKIEKIGLFNPRLNTAYYKFIKDIPEEVIERVKKEVIGY